MEFAAWAHLYKYYTMKKILVSLFALLSAPATLGAQELNYTMIEYMMTRPGAYDSLLVRFVAAARDSKKRRRTRGPIFIA
jgi:hypothetical protein